VRDFDKGPKEFPTKIVRPPPLTPAVQTPCSGTV
jgi:hypothetical protein